MGEIPYNHWALYHLPPCLVYHYNLTLAWPLQSPIPSSQTRLCSAENMAALLFRQPGTLLLVHCMASPLSFRRLLKYSLLRSWFLKTLFYSEVNPLHHNSLGTLDSLFLYILPPYFFTMLNCHLTYNIFITMFIIYCLSFLSPLKCFVISIHLETFVCFVCWNIDIPRA